MFAARTPDDSIDPKTSIALQPYDLIELSLSNMTLAEAVRFSDNTGVLYLNDDPSDVTGYYGLEVEHGSPVSYGIPWLLSDGRVFKEFPKAATTAALQWVHMCLERVHLLTNVVHQDHKVAIRWLQALGFSIDLDNPILINGEPVCVFWQYSTYIAPTGGFANV